MTLDGGRHHDPFGIRHPPAALERVTAEPGSVPVGLEQAQPYFADGRETGHGSQRRLTGTWPTTAMVAELISSSTPGPTK
jgi:hypothetical protein